MPQTIPNMAQMLTLIGDVLPFIRKRVGPENTIPEGGGKMLPYTGGSGRVTDSQKYERALLQQSLTSGPPPALRSDTVRVSFSGKNPPKPWTDGYRWHEVSPERWELFPSE
jgi:hypothetical protein